MFLHLLSLPRLKVVPPWHAMEVPEHPEGFAGLFLGQLKSVLIQVLLFLPSPYALMLFSVFLINL